MKVIDGLCIKVVTTIENMFYNTGIGTFIWILSNRKEDPRKRKIQLIDATVMQGAGLTKQ